MASPGATSRTNSKPATSNATLSEANIYSTEPFSSRLPNTSGRIPKGSRNATMPCPIIIAKHA